MDRLDVVASLQPFHRLADCILALTHMVAQGECKLHFAGRCTVPPATWGRSRNSLLPPEFLMLQARCRRRCQCTLAAKCMSTTCTRLCT
jgi:hypothetical protein